MAQGQALGGLKNEDADFEKTVRGMMSGDFDDWPNEAGVSFHLFIIDPEPTLTGI